VSPDILEQSPLFEGAGLLLLNSAIVALHPAAAAPGTTIIRKGDPAHEMYLICRGEVEVIDASGTVISTLKDGVCFGEIGLLMSVPRTATVRAKSVCDRFILHRNDLVHILRDHPRFAETLTKVARKRYELVLTRHELISPA
jgi:CRP-like cAMP-binding protein